MIEVLSYDLKYKELYDQKAKNSRVRVRVRVWDGIRIRVTVRVALFAPIRCLVRPIKNAFLEVSPSS